MVLKKYAQGIETKGHYFWETMVLGVFNCLKTLQIDLAWLFLYSGVIIFEKY